MFSFQTKYITCPSSIDGDDPKKSVNHPSKSENQMEKSENQTYHRESCDWFSRVIWGPTDVRTFSTSIDTDNILGHIILLNWFMDSPVVEIKIS